MHATQQSRPQQAKRHLDRARQYFWKSVMLLRKGVQMLKSAEKLQGDDDQKQILFKGSQALQEAQQCMYIVKPSGSQEHVAEKKTALSELYEAYKLIRDYEMNPLPPVTFTGDVNLSRIAEDTVYWKIMGTDRMEPNRLGIGREAREKWRAAGYWDYNYYPGATTTPDNDQLLYHNISSDDVHGPKEWAAYHDWKRTTKKRVSDLPLSLTLQHEGYWPRALRPDTALALTNIHQHFFAPVPSVDWQGHLKIDTVLPYAVPGQVNNNPRWQNQPARFYPTGPPEYGIPVCVTVGDYWDARVACNFLKSPDGKQACEFLEFLTLQQSGAEHLEQKVTDNPHVDHLQQKVTNHPHVDHLQQKVTDHPHVDHLQQKVTDHPHVDHLQQKVTDKGFKQQPLTEATVTRRRVKTTLVSPKYCGRPKVGQASAYNNLLQHALFLLCAPATPWMQKKLPKHLWITGNIPQDYQRTSGNIWPWPSKKGWSLTLPDSKTPVGPFVLDEEFGDPGHIPGPNYYPERSSSQKVHHNVWLVRTNQKHVNGEETWGLDFL